MPQRPAGIAEDHANARALETIRARCLIDMLASVELGQIAVRAIADRRNAIVVADRDRGNARVLRGGGRGDAHDGSSDGNGRDQRAVLHFVDELHVSFPWTV